jgi:hypothetical protein
MNAVIRKLRPDLCPICGKERAVECYNRMNAPMRFRYIVDSYIRNGKINMGHIPVTHMKCRECGKIFDIRWDNGVPYPMADNVRISTFLDKGYSVSELGDTYVKGKVK